jgi:transcriptional regulator with XRE-family HTH domain
MRPKYSALREQIQDRGISVRSIAQRVGVNQSHILRVLNGERPGSRALLASIAELVETMGDRRAQEEDGRLIRAAVHMFFLKRGNFESDIFNSPAERVE